MDIGTIGCCIEPDIMVMYNIVKAMVDGMVLSLRLSRTTNRYPPIQGPIVPDIVKAMLDGTQPEAQSSYQPISPYSKAYSTRYCTGLVSSILYMPI